MTPRAAPAHLPTLLDCVHCGLCLPECPTYRVTGREVESPRGRIAALRALTEEIVPPSAALHAGLEDCLVCRACESVCPSGISMEALMTGYRWDTRPRLADLRARLERWALGAVIARPARLHAAMALLRIAAPLLRGLALVPDLPARSRLRNPAPLAAPQPATATPRGTVAIFRGCIADRWFRAETNAAAAVLARNGWRVVFPPAVCCGALHRHAGLLEGARTLAKLCADAILSVSSGGAIDHVVVDAAGCAAALAEPGMNADSAVAAVARRVTNTPTLLAHAGWEPPRKKLPGRWTVAPPCHEIHGPIGNAGTRTILASVLDCGYSELPRPEHCCGAAGLYMLRRPRLSRAIGAEALRRFDDSGADGVISGNPGCLLRWEGLLSERGGRALHPAVAVDQAYRL